MKRVNPAKRICPFLKTISQQFQGSDIYTFIARLSKKSKKDDFGNFAYNEINNLQTPTSLI